MPLQMTCNDTFSTHINIFTYIISIVLDIVKELISSYDLRIDLKDPVYKNILPKTIYHTK